MGCAIWYRSRAACWQFTNFWIFISLWNTWRKHYKAGSIWCNHSCFSWLKTGLIWGDNWFLFFLIYWHIAIYQIFVNQWWYFFSFPRTILKNRFWIFSE